MKRGRLPLTALRSFEAAGRHLSFSRAAEELFVSQAAVSRQIRELEIFVAQPLFERQHRRVVLTDAGRRLLAQLTASFDAIDRQVQAIIEKPARHTVSISAEPAFAAAWLMPQLNLFNAEMPDVDVIIDASPALVEFRANAMELAIRHSMTASSWPRVQSRHLIDCRMMPVVAPSLLSGGPPLTSPADLASYPLLHVSDRDDWTSWFRSVGVDDVELQRGPIFPDSALTAQSAALGHGVALSCHLLSGSDLESGRLVAPFPTEIAYGAYWLVAPDFEQLSEPAAAFADWLVAALDAEAKTAWAA